uniref:Inhibitor of growth protein n=1 Tax=Caligus rogercresseyi TaxID=217165 RepID=C1BNW8_CALRO|nr:Inhibitor of growth protein 1 [Caligus rogercresseyi]|eukprot:TRINITY_DN5457_c0_g1_i1.p1 TRINITY_DN5457_c0_g1~~TRINITY_DN5457_c0_g1_i1.p1  ORF type:complete len:304 (-),score=109.61 TRINITY_DN5457_c0_g1_i1:117-1028(-)
MQNQAAVEALYSATFVEDYMDCIENLPNELQRSLSILKEYDLRQRKEFIHELEELVESFEKDNSSASAQRSTLLRIQQGLILTQDIGDDKLATVQTIADLIENKSRQLEQDSKNLDFREEKPPGGGGTTGNASHTSKVQKNARTQSDNEKSASGKRRRKQNERKDDKEDARSTVASNNSYKSKGNSGKKPGSKRKGNMKKSLDKDDSDREDVDLNIDFDPNEPTYCLCEQVSYGEMIGCDNDLCPIEWFHFNCVQLSNKPKGKWYCPKCRGDKSTVMKPKAQFLKELEKFNREKEEKTMKQNG